jgi:UDP-N-acetylmuramoyl-tripeptide--D-alanyl-D-alanine ligase
MEEAIVENLVFFVTNILFVTTLGWYLITNLQWYDYKIERVILRHHKQWWHIVHFIVPLIAYYTTGKFFIIFYFFAALPSLWIWHKKLDKKLVMTWRVKRFLVLLVTLSAFGNFLCLLKEACAGYGVFMPLLVAYIGSTAIEKFLFLAYKKEAQKKLTKNENLKVIAITGSYGKTSIKNFIADILAKEFTVYATPRSVNTLGGIIRDINESLPQNCDFYICEAGARERGDILDIANLINPHYVVVGKVGLQHIEYFKTIENIKATKLELMQSNRLIKAFVHTSVTDEVHDKVTHFGDDIVNINATLEGTNFSLNIDNKSVDFNTSILGAFQTMNIDAAVLIAHAVGMNEEVIKKAVQNLKSVEHRLQRIDAGGKIILDDGYNGNIDGMLEGVRLCSLHPKESGKRVIVTPGLVESSDELNIELIEAINKVFDFVIVTGSLNAKLFEKHLNVKDSIVLSNKASLELILGEKIKAGDVILFANDAPNFI